MRAMFKKIITEMEGILKSKFQYEIYTGCDKKNTVDRINGRLYITEEDITKFELNLS